MTLAGDRAFTGAPAQPDRAGKPVARSWTAALAGVARCGV